VHCMQGAVHNALPAHRAMHALLPHRALPANSTMPAHNALQAHSKLHAVVASIGLPLHSTLHALLALIALHAVLAHRALP